MSAALGEDWRELFDFAAVNCLKPRFFQPDINKAKFREFDL